MKKSMRAIRIAGSGALAIGAIITGALAGSSAVASATGSQGDQDAVAYAAELKAAAPSDGLEDTTPIQARNIAWVVCGQRKGGYSEREVIAQMTGPQQPHQYAVVLVTRAEFHFCSEYS